MLGKPGAAGRMGWGFRALTMNESGQGALALAYRPTSLYVCVVFGNRAYGFERFAVTGVREWFDSSRRKKAFARLLSSIMALADEGRQVSIELQHRYALSCPPVK